MLNILLGENTIGLYDVLSKLRVSLLDLNQLSRSFKQLLAR